MDRLIGLSAAALLIATAATAQTWQMRDFVNPQWHTASVDNGRDAFFLYCGGPVPGGPGLPPSDEPLVTAPYTLMLTLYHPGLGRGGGVAGPRGDVVITVGDTGYQLPSLGWNELEDNGWVQWLSMADPLIIGMLAGGQVTVTAGGQPVARDPGTGMPDALAAMIHSCHSYSAVLGHPVPPAVAPVLEAVRLWAEGAPEPLDDGPAPLPGAALPPAPGAGGTMARMNASVAAHCAGPHVIAPDQVTTVELNNDGVPDTILFWGGVTCTTGQWAGVMAGGNCGASQCLTSVFVSGTGRGAAADAGLFTQGPVLDPARPGQVGFFLRLGACRQAGLMPDCVAWHRWTGTELIRIN